MPVHLLLAEADPALCSRFASFFHSVGFEVETVTTGLECLDRLRSHCPEALIIDLDLPEGGGDSVLALLNQGETPRPRAVIALGDKAPMGLNSRLGASPVDCLRKPVHASSLALRVALQLFDPIAQDTSPS